MQTIKQLLIIIKIFNNNIEKNEKKINKPSHLKQNVLKCSNALIFFLQTNLNRLIVKDTFQCFIF